MLSMSNQRVRLKKNIVKENIKTLRARAGLGFFVEKRKKKSRRKTAVANIAKKGTVNAVILISTFLGLICHAFSFTIAPHFDSSSLSVCVLFFFFQDGEGITLSSVFFWNYYYYFPIRYSGLILPNRVTFWVGRWTIEPIRGMDSHVRLALGTNARVRGSAFAHFYLQMSMKTFVHL